MTFRKALVPAFLAIGVMALSSCESSKERAEKFYQSGMAYLEQGDVDRAIVEFRNVFKLDGEHTQARRAYAEIERNRGNLREAFSQYLRLAEQDPADLDALRALSEMAVANGDWEVAERYATPAAELAPQDPQILALKAAADYGRATADADSAGIVDAMNRVKALRETSPDNILLRRVIVDDRLRAQDFNAALAEIDEAIAIEPKDRQLNAQRLTVLSALGDEQAVEDGLIDMVQRFPEAPEMSATLVRWYVSRDELDKAEAHLRARIDLTAPDITHVFDLVRFLAEHRGTDAAVAELDKVIASGATSPIFKSARAGFLFDLGRRDEAIADMRAVLEQSDSADDTRRIKIGLARMLSASDQDDEARTLVDEVLAEDSGYVEAMKLQAGWDIRDDKVGDAIAILRRALDDSPSDPSLMTLMARAYERDGNRDLMREMLSLAVNASNRAPDESLRYAQFLATENKLVQAEGVLIDALRLTPGNTHILMPLGQVYVAMQDWPRASAVANQLAASSQPAARNAAVGLQAAVLNGQKNSEEAIGYLQNLVDSGKGDLGTKIAILRTYVSNNQIDRALAYANQLSHETPDDPEIEFINGSVQLLDGNTAAAETIMRKLVEADPSRNQAWLALVRIVASDPKRTEETRTLIAEAQKAAPDAPELKWAQAGILERTGDYAGAIGVYEALYKENTGNPIIANNLASLLSVHGADEDSLNRAEIIARRLRGSTVPAFQDTYGWIAYLRGNYKEAVSELEKAAAGMPDDPSVQFHLAKTYLALDRKSDALAQYRRMEGLFPQGVEKPGYAAEADKDVQALEAGGTTVGN